MVQYGNKTIKELQRCSHSAHNDPFYIVARVCRDLKHQWQHRIYDNMFPIFNVKKLFKRRLCKRAIFAHSMSSAITSVFFWEFSSIYFMLVSSQKSRRHFVSSMRHVEPRITLTHISLMIRRRTELSIMLTIYTVC